ncbi:hypothetical protein BH23PLA1_BH23PLA1_35630 [soil metagenome]
MEHGGELRTQASRIVSETMRWELDAIALIDRLNELTRMPDRERLAELRASLNGEARDEIKEQGDFRGLCVELAGWMIANHPHLNPSPVLALSRLIDQAYDDLPGQPDMLFIEASMAAAYLIIQSLRAVLISSPEAPADPARRDDHEATPAEANPFHELSPPGKALAAAYDLKREGRPVTIKAACARARVDRSHLTNRYPEAVQLIKALGTPDRQLSRGWKDRETGTMEAWNDDEE